MTFFDPIPPPNPMPLRERLRILRAYDWRVFEDDKIEAAVAELEARARRGEMAPRDLQEVRAQLADTRKLLADTRDEARAADEAKDRAESTVTALGALLRRVRNDVIRDDQWQGTDLLAAVDEALGALNV